MDHVIDEWKRWRGSQEQANEGRTEQVWGEATAPVISCNSLSVADVSRMSTCILHVELFWYSCY